MKTIIFILFFIPIQVFSQISVSGVIGVSASNTTPKSGYARAGSPFGISIREDLNQHIFLTQAALFRFDGYYFKKDLPPEIGSHGDTIRDLGYKSIVHQFNYLEFPFMVNYIAKKGKVKPYLGTGFSAKFCVRSVERIAVQYRIFEFNWLEQQNSIDLNLLGSLGVEFNVLKHPVDIEARYNHGLINVIDNKKISSVALFLIIR